jgi:hypothetical protein
MPIKFSKSPGDLYNAAVGPFVVKIRPKGDGRWAWEVFRDDTRSPMATGVASSLGAAKNVTEQFVKRQGLI